MFSFWWCGLICAILVRASCSLWILRIASLCSMASVVRSFSGFMNSSYVQYLSNASGHTLLFRHSK